MAMAASSPIMFRLLSTTTTIRAAASISTMAFSPSIISNSNHVSHLPKPLKLNPISRRPLRRFSSSAATPITATISVGQNLPDSTLSYIDDAGELQTTTISDLTKGKKAILFAVPGAFTPTCSQKHLPGFVQNSAEFKSKGVDVIACISVNDAFVMKAWKENLKINDEVLLLSDGNGDFTRAIGAELDLRDKPVGLGVRSRRYAMLVEDGVVKVLNMEEGGAFTTSSAEDMLKML